MYVELERSSLIRVLIWTELKSVAYVKMMGSALARHTGGEEAEVIRHLVQRVSILLTEVNSNLLLNPAPSNIPPEMDGANS